MGQLSLIIACIAAAGVLAQAGLTIFLVWYTRKQSLLAQVELLSNTIATYRGLEQSNLETFVNIQLAAFASLDPEERKKGLEEFLNKCRKEHKKYVCQTEELLDPLKLRLKELELKLKTTGPKTRSST